MPMDVRLPQLLSSFVEAHARYSLARLEFALAHPAKASPPLVESLAETSENALRSRWTRVETQLDEALGFTLRLERARRRKHSSDRTFRLFAQALRELDRASRAVRWALTVTESHYDF